MTLLKVTHLTRDHFAAELVTHLTGNGLHPQYRDGMHTLSACGELTMLDVKHIDHSPMRRVIDIERRIRRMFGKGKAV
jgi:hypothetical protein